MYKHTIHSTYIYMYTHSLHTSHIYTIIHHACLCIKHTYLKILHIYMHIYYTCAQIYIYMHMPHTGTHKLATHIYHAHKHIHPSYTQHIIPTYIEASMHTQVPTNTFEFLLPPGNGFKSLLLCLLVYTPAQNTITESLQSSGITNC